MKLSQLTAAHRKKGRRLGRGKGSGKGGTSTKGHKGQKARSGVSLKPGFEGGQMSLARRLPKFGFTNKKFKTVYDVVNLDQIQGESDSQISFTDMINKGWTRKGNKVKVLGRGALKKAVQIEAHRFSRSAQSAIEKQGGSVQVIALKSK